MPNLVLTDESYVNSFLPPFTTTPYPALSSRGQLSWMLSCPHAAVEAYPADYILGFCRAIDPLLSVGKSIVRYATESNSQQGPATESNSQ